MAYRSPVLGVDDVNLSSGFHLGKDELLLNGLAADTHGGTFEGTAKLEHFRTLQLSGRLANFGLQQFAAFLNRRIPWSGRVSGPLSIDGPLALPPRETAFQTTLEITPAKGGVPLSGTLELSKNGRSDLRFGKSQLALPATQASFQGALRSGIDATIDSTNLADLTSILDFFKINHPEEYSAGLLPGGSAHFTGTLAGSASDPAIDGAFSLTRFKINGKQRNQLHGQGK
jgi:autotransporter translocation and assembly factor TamB